MRRATIARLMGLIGICAAAIAAVSRPGILGCGLFGSLAAFLLGVALLGMFSAQGRGRAYWRGFAVFGWGYAIVSMAPWFSDEVAPVLPTTLLLNDLGARAEEWDIRRQEQKVLDVAAARARANRTTPDVELQAAIDIVNEQVAAQARSGRIDVALGSKAGRIRCVGQWTFALVLGAIGAAISRRMQVAWQAVDEGPHREVTR